MERDGLTRPFLFPDAWRFKEANWTICGEMNTEEGKSNT